MALAMDPGMPSLSKFGDLTEGRNVAREWFFLIDAFTA